MNERFVMSSWYYDDQREDTPSVLFQRTVIRHAARDHKIPCSCCKKPILKGEKYELHVIMTTEDDKPWSDKAHYFCKLASEYGAEDF
jgi:hypothetical protein